MKKILLGLLAVSAIAMGNTITNTGDEPEQTVIIETKATVISSGLIIASAANSNTQLDKLSLDHGTINQTDLMRGHITETPANFVIKRSTDNEYIGKQGYSIAIRLVHDGLLKTTNASDTISHKLIAIIAGGKLDVSTDIKTKEMKLTGEEKVIEGYIKSEISQRQNYALNGEYTNTATLNVKISKPSAQNPSTR